MNSGTLTVLSGTVNIGGDGTLKNQTGTFNIRNGELSFILT